MSKRYFTETKNGSRKQKSARQFEDGLGSQNYAQGVCGKVFRAIMTLTESKSQLIWG